MGMSKKKVARIVIISLLISICPPPIHTHTSTPKKNFKETTKDISKLIYNAAKLYMVFLLYKEIPEQLGGVLELDGDESYPKKAFEAFSFCVAAATLIESVYTHYIEESQKNKDTQIKAEIEQRYAHYLKKQ